MTDQFNSPATSGDQYRSLANTGLFGMFRGLGYLDLIPVIPPDAKIYPKSSLSPKVGTKIDARGKAPGKKGPDGLWHGYSWLKAPVANEDDLRRWHAMGASVGLRCGAVIAVDVDTLDAERAAGIGDLVTRHFGGGAALPMRVGRAPKRLYLLRASDPENPPPYQSVEFETPQERVEILSVGKQAVIAGVHPKTGKPYQWMPAPPALSDLPTASEADVEAFLSAVADTYGGRIDRPRSLAKSETDQAALKAPIDLVRRIVDLLPNDSRTAPGRAEWIKVGYMIKGATQDDPDEGLELWQDWSARWVDGDNDPDLVDAEWHGLKPPFRVGVQQLSDLAERTSDRPDEAAALAGEVDTVMAERWFGPVPDEISHVEAAQERPPTKSRLRASPFLLQDAAAIPPRDWLYGQHYLRRYVSVTVATGGVGKSSLTIVEALALATGRPLIGVEPKRPCCVWVVNLEDDIDELRRRATAACLRYGVTGDEIGGRMFLSSGRDLPDFKIVRAARDGVEVDEALVDDLVRELEERQIDVLILDPFVSTHAAAENDNGAVDRVVKTLASVASRAECAVMIVHHVRKVAGRAEGDHQTTVADARGGSAIVDGARIVRPLSRMGPSVAKRLGLSEEQRRAMFQFGDAKANFSPATAAEHVWFRMTSELLPNGDWVGVVERVELAAAPTQVESEEDTVKRLLARLAGTQWRADRRARKGTWIGEPIADELGLDCAVREDGRSVGQWIEKLETGGHIVHCFEKDERRHRVAFYRTALETGPRTSDIFD